MHRARAGAPPCQGGAAAPAPGSACAPPTMVQGAYICISASSDSEPSPPRAAPSAPLRGKTAAALSVRMWPAAPVVILIAADSLPRLDKLAGPRALPILLTHDNRTPPHLQLYRASQLPNTTVPPNSCPHVPRCMVILRRHRGANEVSLEPPWLVL